MIEQDKRYGDAPLLLTRSSRRPDATEPSLYPAPIGLSLSDAGLNTKQVVAQPFNQVALMAAKLSH